MIKFDIPRINWVGHVAGMGERRGVYRILVVKSEGKRLLGRARRRCEDNIKDGSSGSGMWGTWTR